MQTRRTFAIASAGACLTGVLGMLGCKGLGSTTYEGRLIRSVTYSYGGGMTGGGESIELRRQKDGSVTLSTREREWHDSRETGYDYVVNEAAFERFAEIANEYGLLKASKRKYSDMVVLDAATGHVSYTVMGEDGEYDLDASFSISSEQELSDKEWDGFNMVRTALTELAAESVGVAYLEPIRLTLVASGVQYQFVLNGSSAAQDLASRCPLDIKLEDYGTNEKIFYLDEPLDTSDTPPATGAAGTVCYFEPWNDVVFFYDEGEPHEGLYELGAIESAYDVQFLAEVEPGDHGLWSTY